MMCSLYAAGGQARLYSALFSRHGYQPESQSGRTSCRCSMETRRRGERHQLTGLQVDSAYTRTGQQAVRAKHGRYYISKSHYNFVIARY